MSGHSRKRAGPAHQVFVVTGSWVKKNENHLKKSCDSSLSGTWAMDGMLEWVGFYNRLTSLPASFSAVHYL